MNMKEAAVETLEKHCQECNNALGGCGEKDREGCWIYNARIAMIRAIPENPVVKGGGGYGDEMRFYCPSCRRQLAHRRNNNMWFCPRCGKAIDWEV